MKVSIQERIRQSVMYWILMPILATLAVFALIEISRQFSGQGIIGALVGIIVIAAAALPIAGHLVFLSALVGLAILPFGLYSDKRFVMPILLGLVYGGVVLYKVYVH